MPFSIVRNDITKMHVDAIVNTANPRPECGAGTDRAVYEAAGADRLLEKRHEIGMIDRGTSVITEGFDLPAKYIIHTVGTRWMGGNEGEEETIRNCYRSIFRLAVENKIESLAIPLLASGCYGFPKGVALRIALSEIESFMAEHDLTLFLVVFDEKSFALSSELYGDIDAYINDNYVEEKAAREYADEEYADSKEYADADVYMDSDVYVGSADGATQARSMAAFDAAFEQTPSAKKDTHFELFHDKKSKRKQKRAEESGAEKAVLAGMLCAAPMPAKRSLDDVVKNLDKSFMDMVFSFADAKGLTDAQVQKKANLNRKAFSKLRCGITKNPSKNTALALAIALELNLDDTKDLLSRAGFALSPCSKQDVIVRYFIEREAYDIFAVNIALFEHGEEPLGHV